MEGAPFELHQFGLVSTIGVRHNWLDEPFYDEIDIVRCLEVLRAHDLHIECLRLFTNEDHETREQAWNMV